MGNNCCGDRADGKSSKIGLPTMLDSKVTTRGAMAVQNQKARAELQKMVEHSPESPDLNLMEFENNKNTTPERYGQGLTGQMFDDNAHVAQNVPNDLEQLLEATERYIPMQNSPEEQVKSARVNTVNSN